MDSFFFLPLLLTSLYTPFTDKPAVDDQSDVAKVLEQLGDTPVEHQINQTISGVSAEAGQKLVVEGFAKKPKGGRTKKLSAHFVCTSCHNIEKEDPDFECIGSPG